MNVRGHDELTSLLFGGDRQLVNIKLCPADRSVDPLMLRAQVGLALDQAKAVEGVKGFDENHIPQTNVAEWVATF
ncbi:MAG: hypothetical protein ACREEY_09050 [Brevundimonas sp.]